MALKFNGTDVPQSGEVRFNNTALAAVKMGATEVWKRQKTVYPGAPVANTQNLGYGPYFTVTNNGSDIKVDAFGGTERGWGRVILGPFSSVGYSKLYFSALRAYITNAFSKIAVSLGDINGNWVQRLIYHDTGESLGGYDVTFGSGDLFTINSANANYYLILEVDSGATARGLNATIQMNGCYLNHSSTPLSPGPSDLMISGCHKLPDNNLC